MTHTIDHAIFDVAKVLEVPVLVLALAALAIVVIEIGAFAVELRNRQRRNFAILATAADEASSAARRRDTPAVAEALRAVAWSGSMAAALTRIADYTTGKDAEPRIAKALADFDFTAQRRLERTRLLVRVGPALGLMGTLIPLSPALDGLARGNVQQLSDNLRVAFSVTVLGLLVGAIAFALSLYRDRVYGQDLSDLEYVAAVLTAPGESDTAS